MATHSSILVGESLGQRSLAGYIPRGCKRVGCNLMTKQQQKTQSKPVHPVKGLEKIKEAKSTVSLNFPERRTDIGQNVIFPVIKEGALKECIMSALSVFHYCSY